MKTFEQSVLPYIKAVTAKKAENVVVIDLRGLTSYTDLLIIASAHSMRQVSAIGEHVRRELRKRLIKPLGVEGLREGEWVLMDYGHVIIHIFLEEVRRLYDLEGFWCDAKRMAFEEEPRPKAVRQM